MAFELRWPGTSIVVDGPLVDIRVEWEGRWLVVRDDEAPPLHGLAARMDRALQNFKETFPFFVAGVVLVGVTRQTNSLTQTGAGLYFACRVLYVPIYAIGIPYFRTLVWCASVVGLVTMVAGACP